METAPSDSRLHGSTGARLYQSTQTPGDEPIRELHAVSFEHVAIEGRCASRRPMIERAHRDDSYEFQ
jgi:hypothetical protein